MSVDPNLITLGTKISDDLSGGRSQEIIFGLQGDDKLKSGLAFGENFFEAMFLVGGTGSDSYRWNGAGGTVVVDTGGDNDVYNGGTIKADYYAEIYGKHLIMLDYSGDFVLFANYKDPLFRIENFNIRLDSGSWNTSNYTYDQILPALKKDSGWLGSLSHSQMGVSSEDKQAFEDMLEEIIQLSNTYEEAANQSDSVSYAGDFEKYSINKSDAGYKVIDSNGKTRLLDGVTTVKFNDYSVSLDTEGVSGQAYRLYKAAFDRQPDTRGLGFWIDSLENSTSMHDVANSFINSNEFKSLYGDKTTNEDFLTALYNNVLDRSPDNTGLDWWLDSLDSGKSSRADVLVGFSESAENKVNTVDLIANGVMYEEWLG